MRRNKAPPEPTQQWPPRSPREALTSTPEGRKKYKQIIHSSPTRSPSRMSPSRKLLFGSPSRPASMLSPTRPSPAARAMSALSAKGTKYANMGGEVNLFDDVAGDDEGEDEDEDEETLRLKLEAIEARLKLKRLMNAKKNLKAGGDAPTPAGAATKQKIVGAVELGGRLTTGTTSGLGLGLQDAPPITRRQPASSSARPESSRTMRQARGGSRGAESGEDVQVPASPAKDIQKDSDPPGKNTGGYLHHRVPSPVRPFSSTSVGTSRLGMDSRASVTTNTSSASNFHAREKYLERRSHAAFFSAEEPKQSFAERLAAARQDEDDRREKEWRIKAARHDTFGISEREMEEYKSHATTIEPALGDTGSDSAPSFSREEILNTSSSKSRLGRDKRGEGEPGMESLEPYSGVHLKTRILPHQALTRTLSEKKILLLKDLLRDVRAPNFELPDVEADIVVMAIVASKSEPKNHKSDNNGNNPSSNATANANKNQDGGNSGRGKFMVLTLTDLQFEIDLFLFDAGFSRFWKLPTGHLVAILNPNIMPPPPGRADTGRFSLVVNSDADTVLEVGSSRDLGHCAAMRRDGRLCSSWVNLRRTEFCEFHVNEAVKKKRMGRMEVNTMDGFSPFSRGGGRGGIRGGGKGSRAEREKYRPGGDSWKAKGPKDYDRETHSKIFVSGGGGSRSTASVVASLTENEATRFADRREKEEFLKSKFSREEKERDIACKLAKMGGKAGSEYMDHRAGEMGAATLKKKGPELDTSGLIRPAKGKRVAMNGDVTMQGGDGTAATPYSTATTLVQPSAAEPQTIMRSARALGLIPTQGGTDLTLKRKRPVDIISSSSASAARASHNPRTHASSGAPTTSATSPGGKPNGTALGWGSNLKTKLSRMRDGADTLIPKPQAQGPMDVFVNAAPEVERGGEDGEPVRKKTRFVTDHGVKEAGRDSMGGVRDAAAAAAVADAAADSSDDDLVIV